MTRSSRSQPAGEAADESKGATGTTPEHNPAEDVAGPSEATAEASGVVEPVISEARPETAPIRSRELHPLVPAERKDDHRTFARMSDKGTVLEIILEVQNIEQEWHPDVLKTFVDITEEKEKPEPGWTRDNRKFKKPEPEELTLAQKRRVAMEVEGATVGKSKVKLASEVWQRLAQIAQYAALFKELPAGDVTLPGEPPLVFKNADDFLATYKALSVWRERWNKHVDGTLDTAPSSDLIV